MLNAQSEKNFFLTIVVITFLVVSGSALVLGTDKLVNKKLTVNKASEINYIEPCKTEVASEIIYDFPSFPQYPNSEVVSSYRKEEGDNVGKS